MGKLRMWMVVGYVILSLVGAFVVAAWFRPWIAFVLVYVMFPLKQLMGTYLPIFMTMSPLFNYVVFAGVMLAVLGRAMRRERPLSGMGNGFTVVTLTLYAWA